MKRVTAAKNACLAMAGLVAAGALAYAMAFVVWAPVKRVENYEALVKNVRKLVDPPPCYDRNQISAVWTALPPPPPTSTPPRLDVSLAGTTVCSDPKRSTAVVNTASGQSLVRVGDRVQSARLDAIAAGAITFDFLGKPFPLKMNRFDK